MVLEILNEPPYRTDDLDLLGSFCLIAQLCETLGQAKSVPHTWTRSISKRTMVEFTYTQAGGSLSFLPRAYLNLVPRDPLLRMIFGVVTSR